MTLLALIGILAQSATASAWSWPLRRTTRTRWVAPVVQPVTPSHRPPAANPAPNPVPRAVPVSMPAAPSLPAAPASPKETLCDGLSDLPAAQLSRQGGFITQNLTAPGMTLSGVPNAYQGRRLRFGSCSMAAALTQFNGYARSRHIILTEAENPPFYRLGTIIPRHRAWVFRSLGEGDEAVESNFIECHGAYAASAPGMADCLAHKLGDRVCLTPEMRQVPCPLPRAETFQGSLDQRRAFLRRYFNQADPAAIIPVTFPWDTRLVMGPPQMSDADVDLEHVSAMIGRRITPAGRCEVLIRNSWGTCSTWNQQYAFGTCDNPGRTDDVWVDSESFLRRSAELTWLHDQPAPPAADN